MGTSAVMRPRFTVAIVSFVAFVLIVAKLCLQPLSPAVMATRPLAGRKVSVVVTMSGHTPSHIQQLDKLCSGISQVLSRDKLESEFLVSGLDQLTSDLQELKVKGHHVELVPQGAGFSETVLNAFERAHFSVVLVVSDVWLPVELVPLLVEPVVSRDSDITLTQHADSSLLLGLLAFPLTRSLAGGFNSSDFCLHRAVWKRACPGVSPRAASLSLELLARCSLHSHSVLIVGGASSRHHISTAALLPQIFVLYFCTHPLWSCVAMATLVLLIVVCARAKRLTRTASSGKVV